MQLRGKDPVLFGGSHGERCLSYIFGLVMKIHSQRRIRHKKLYNSKAISASVCIFINILYTSVSINFIDYRLR